MTNSLDRIRPPAGQDRGDIALQQLLDQVEGVDDFPDMADLAAAQRVEAGDVELHHSLIDVLAEEHADKGGHLVAFGDQGRHLAAQFGIAGAYRIPHLAHFGLAAAVAHMGRISIGALARNSMSSVQRSSAASTSPEYRTLRKSSTC